MMDAVTSILKGLTIVTGRESKADQSLKECAPAQMAATGGKNSDVEKSSDDGPGDR